MSVRDFVDSIASGDNLSAETHFTDALSAKVGSALETKRKDVARTGLVRSYEMTVYCR